MVFINQVKMRNRPPNCEHENSVVFRDFDGAAVFRVSAPSMRDTNGVSSSHIRLKTEELKNS